MAVLFSAVTLSANDQEVEFFVGGIPRELDDLEGRTAFGNFIETALYLRLRGVRSCALIVNHLL